MRVDRFTRPRAPRGGALRGGAYSIILKLAYAAGQLFLGIALARFLGPTGFGRFAFIMAVVQLLLIVAQWGIPTHLTREVAMRRGGPTAGAAGSMVTSGIVLAALIGAILASAWLAIDQATGANRLNGVAFAVAMVPCMAVAAVSSGAIRGMGHPAASLLAEETLRPLIALMLGGIVVLSGQAIGLRTAFVLYLAAAAIGLAVSFFLLRRYVSALSAPGQWRVALVGVGAAGLPFLIQTGAQTLSLQVDIILLGLITPGSPVGFYRTAAQVAEGPVVLLVGIATVLAPRLAQAQTDSARLRTLLIRAHRAAILLVLPLFGVVLFAGQELVSLVFGVEYVPATTAMQILVGGKLLYAAMGFIGLALAMIGRTWVASGVTGAVIVVNVVLDLILIPRFGVEGAAIADATSNFLVVVGGAAYLHRQLDGGVSAFARRPSAPAPA